ncbi:hypothetical protein Sjap_021239 [Stephania japonica]|uniref:Glabrous enhancer-binding protein-like DBD domain-containing protein n=1 Tax=Stephania japonica TaxID=461633 RepID=A0AAP0HSP2_9MAGN
MIDMCGCTVNLRWSPKGSRVARWRHPHGLCLADSRRMAWSDFNCARTLLHCYLYACDDLPQLPVFFVLHEEEDKGDDDASPADRPTAITPTKSSKRSASPVDVDLDHINPKRLKNNKSSYQQRTTWTLQDELILLNAIIDFKKSHNLDPLSDIDSFFHSIKHSLRLQVSTQQLKRKIRGLKDKFNTYAIRAGATKNAKPNDSELYNLSMKIWGQNQNQNEEEEEEGVKEEDDTIATMTTPQKTITPEQRDNNNSTTFLVSPQLSQHDQVSLSHYPYLSRSLHSCQNWTGGLPGSGLGETLAKEGIALIQKSKAEELDRRFRMQQIQETEIYLNRIALIRDQTKLILDALKSSMS